MIVKKIIKVKYFGGNKMGSIKTDYMNKADSIKDELIEIRRHLHRNPEIGFDIPNTASFVKEKLISYGLEPQDIGKNGVTALIGKSGGKTILLRADMDALPIKEQTGLDFASENDYMHACGHDIHTTMLLGAAKMLKENEDQLDGQVKFIFQPAEELLVGGKEMVDAGILENPKVDAAMGMHVWPTGGKGIQVIKDVFMASANNFRIKITGKGSHGAMPYNGVDPVYIGSKIVTGVPELVAREVPFDRSATITMGKFVAEGAVNVIPNEAVIEGTIRTFHNETREYIQKRFVEIVQGIAETYRGSAEVEFLCDVPVLINDPEFSGKAIGYLEEAAEGNFDLNEASPAGGSEDFAYYANEVPSMFYFVAMPDPDSDVHHNVHHPEVIFDESMIPVGSGSIAHAATRWLEDN